MSNIIINSTYILYMVCCLFLPDFVPCERLKNMNIKLLVDSVNIQTWILYSTAETKSRSKKGLASAMRFVYNVLLIVCQLLESILKLINHFFSRGRVVQPILFLLFSALGHILDILKKFFPIL